MGDGQNTDKAFERKSNRDRASEMPERSSNLTEVENTKPDLQAMQIASNSGEKLETAVEKRGSASDSIREGQGTDGNEAKKSPEMSYFEKLFREHETRPTPRSRVEEVPTEKSPGEKKRSLNSSSQGYKKYVLEVFSTKSEESENAQNRSPEPDRATIELNANGFGPKDSRNEEAAEYKEVQAAGTLRRSVEQLAAIEQSSTEEQTGTQWRSVEQLAAIEQSSTEEQTGTQWLSVEQLAAIEQSSTEEQIGTQRRSIGELTDASQEPAAEHSSTQRRSVGEFIVTQQPSFGEDSATQRRSVGTLFNQDQTPEIRVTTSVSGSRSIRMDQADSIGKKSKGYKEYILEVYSTKEESVPDEPSKTSALLEEKEKKEAKEAAELKELEKISAFFEQKEEARKEEQGLVDAQKESSVDQGSKSLNRNEYAAFENGEIKNYEDCILEVYSSVLGNQEPIRRKSTFQGG